MNLVVSVENATTYTPYLTAITLNNATWVANQDLHDNQPIAANHKIVGMLDATLPFSGTITVHYGFVAPGPGGADVIFSPEGHSIGNKPLVGCGWQAQPGTAFGRSSATVVPENQDYYLLLKVRA